MKTLLLISISLLMISIVYATNVDTTIPRDVYKNEYFNITLNVNSDSSKLDIAEFIPKDWKISEWSTSPETSTTLNSNLQSFMGKERMMYHWKFNSAQHKFKINMKVLAKGKGEFEFITLWITPKEFDKISKSVSVTEKPATTSTITGHAIAIENKNTNSTAQNTTHTIQINTTYTQHNLTQQNETPINENYETQTHKENALSMIFSTLKIWISNLF